MSKEVLFLGLDVDDNCFHGHATNSLSGEVLQFSCKPNLSALLGKLVRLSKDGVEMRICYESTYLGFSLCRDLRAKGYDCEVVASSLIPDVSGKKVKTDRLDCEKLSLYYMKGLLTVVHMPTAAEENVRDICRTREFLMGQMKSLKLHILSLCRRSGLNYKEASGRANPTYWTGIHRQWLKTQFKSIDDPNLRFNLESQLLHIEYHEVQIKRYDEEIEKISRKAFYEKRVSALKSFRGIETLTAMIFITELGDVSRFSHPKKITSYVGMDINEYSSGGKEKRFGISLKATII